MMKFKAAVHFGITDYIVEGEAKTWIKFVDKARQKISKAFCVDYHSIGVIRINDRNIVEV